MKKNLIILPLFIMKIRYLRPLAVVTSSVVIATTLHLGGYTKLVIALDLKGYNSPTFHSPDKSTDKLSETPEIKTSIPKRKSNGSNYNDGKPTGALVDDSNYNSSNSKADYTKLLNKIFGPNDSKEDDCVFELNRGPAYPANTPQFTTCTIKLFDEPAYVNDVNNAKADKKEPGYAGATLDFKLPPGLDKNIKEFLIVNNNGVGNREIYVAGSLRRDRDKYLSDGMLRVPALDFFGWGLIKNPIPKGINTIVLVVRDYELNQYVSEAVTAAFRLPVWGNGIINVIQE